MSLSNFELLSLAKYYNIPLVGIFMKDLLPHEPVCGFYIVNLQSSTEGNGTHYTLLVITSKIVIYSDSFGCCPPLEIEYFIKPLRLPFAYNAWIIQNLKSELCGWYALALCMFIHAHPTMQLVDTVNSFIDMFHDNTLDNGPILKKYYKKFPIKPNAFVKRRLLAANIK